MSESIQNDSVANIPPIDAYSHIEPLIITNISVWDDETEKYVDCDVTLTRNLITIDLCYQNECWKYELKKNGTISATIDNVHPFCISIEDTISFMDKDLSTIRVKQIEEYYDRLNDITLTEDQKAYDEIDELFHSIDSIEFENVTVKFIEQLPESLFLDTDTYSAFESVLSTKDYYCRYFLDTEFHMIDEIIDKVNEDERLKSLILSIIKEFNKFSKFVAKNITVKDEYLFSVTWLVIKTLAIREYANKWRNDYGYLFDTLFDEIDFDLFIDAYCNCQDIPHKRLTTVNLFVYFLMDKAFFSENNYLGCSAYVVNKILDKLEILEQDTFETRLIQGKSTSSKKVTIDDVDLMNGAEFEHFIASLFARIGYEVSFTKNTGDQGVDVIAEKNGTKIGIQAKCYSGSVGNSAIQEVVAGKRFYRLDKAIVVTNNMFTSSAIDLAQANDVILWDRSILKDKISSICNET